MVYPRSWPIVCVCYVFLSHTNLVATVAVVAVGVMVVTLRCTSSSPPLGEERFCLKGNITGLTLIRGKSLV